MDKTYPTLELIVQLYEHAEFFYITATTLGEHASGSYHYRSEAIDIGCGLRGNTAALLKAAKTDRFTQMDALAKWLYADSSMITELLHCPQAGYKGGSKNWFVKYGDPVTASYYGPVTVRDHMDHVHFAVASHVDADKLLTVVVQRLLKLPVDGDKGPRTTAAIKAFQSLHKIDVDGNIGQQTVTALRAAQKWAKVV